MARIPEHPIGIRIKKTAKKEGMPITFPADGYPMTMAMLLGADRNYRDRVVGSGHVSCRWHADKTRGT